MVVHFKYTLGSSLLICKKLTNLLGTDANAVPATCHAAISTSCRAATELPATDARSTGSQSTDASSASSSAANERPANEQPTTANATNPQPAAASRYIYFKAFCYLACYCFCSFESIKNSVTDCSSVCFYVVSQLESEKLFKIKSNL